MLYRVLVFLVLQCPVTLATTQVDLSSLSKLTASAFSIITTQDYEQGSWPDLISHSFWVTILESQHGTFKSCWTVRKQKTNINMFDLKVLKTQVHLSCLEAQENVLAYYNSLGNLQIKLVRSEIPKISLSFDDTSIDFKLYSYEKKTFKKLSSSNGNVLSFFWNSLENPLPDRDCKKSSCLVNSCGTHDQLACYRFNPQGLDCEEQEKISYCRKRLNKRCVKGQIFCY